MPQFFNRLRGISGHSKFKVQCSRFKVLLPILLLAQGCANWPQSNDQSARSPGYNRWDEVRGGTGRAKDGAQPSSEPNEVPPLYELIAHPQPGSFSLKPPWGGREEIISNSGLLLVSQKWRQEVPNHDLRFNS